MSNRRRWHQESSDAGGEQSLVSTMFSQFGLSELDFEVRTGRGKSFISGQRIVWMEISQLSTGRKESGRIGTTKKNANARQIELLRRLLQEFSEA